MFTSAYLYNIKMISLKMKKAVQVFIYTLYVFFSLNKVLVVPCALKPTVKR